MSRRLRHAAEGGRRTTRGANGKRRTLWARAFNYVLPAVAAVSILGAASTVNAQPKPPARRTPPRIVINNTGAKASKVKPMGGLKSKPKPAAVKAMFHVDIANDLKTAISVKDSAALGYHVARLNELIWIVRNRKTTGKNRAAYNAAVKSVGGGSWDKTIDGLVAAHITAIKNLHKLVKAGGKLGASKTALREQLKKIMAGAAALDPKFLAYNKVRAQMVALHKAAAGAMAAVPKKAGTKVKKGIVVATKPLPIFYTPGRSLPAVHALKKGTDEAIIATTGTPTPAINSMYDNNSTNATALVNALGAAYATLANHPGTGSKDVAAQKSAATALYNALNNVPAGKEIRSNPTWNTLMTYLQQGNLREALNVMANNPAYNSMLQSIDNLTVLTISNRAIAVMRAGTTIQFDFGKNQRDFRRYIEGLRKGQKASFQPRLLYMALGMHYEYLLLSGQLKNYSVGTDGSINQTGSKRVKGTGHAMSVTPQLAVGASAFGKPMKVVLHCNFGYRDWSLGTNVPDQSGLGKDVNIKRQEGYVGVWGADVYLLPFAGQKSPVRISRLSAGLIGYKNFFANFAIDFQYKHANKYRLSGQFIPQYSYFLGKHQPGATIKPVNLTYQFANGVLLAVSPGVTYKARIDPTDTKNTIHQLDGYGEVTLQLPKGFSIQMKAGVIGEVGGSKAERLPTYPYGMVNLIMRPAEWFKKKKKK